MHFLIFPKQENMFCPFIQVRSVTATGPRGAEAKPVPREEGDQTRRQRKGRVPVPRTGL